MPSKLTGRRVHPIRPKFLPPQHETLRRGEGGVRYLNNAAGRAAYSDMKERQWAAQKCLCDHCHTYMRLENVRLTGGSWKESGQHRNDAPEANLAVHKRCLRPWHQNHAYATDAARQSATKATLGEIAMTSEEVLD